MSRTMAACRFVPYSGNSAGSFAWVPIRSSRMYSSAKPPTDSRPADAFSIRVAAVRIPSAVPSIPFVA